MTSSQRPVAVVTGASSGIGAAFAEALAHRGFDLIVVARRADRLTAMAEALKAAAGVDVEVFAADLANGADVRRVADHLAKAPRLAMLVNNAGLGDMGGFAEVTPDSIDRTIAVNVSALVQLTHAALPNLAVRNGAVINVASVLGIMIINAAAVYSATKAFVIYFTRALHGEFGEKVRFQALLPGITRTEFFGDDAFLGRVPPERIMEPRDLVEASLAGLDLGELVCIPSAEDVSAWAEAVDRLQAQGALSSSNRTAARYHS